MMERQYSLCPTPIIMTAPTPRLRLGTPKGSLQDTTQKPFVKAGHDLRISGRSYHPDIGDAELQCILIRPREMARDVAEGILDCACSGLDRILETGADEAELADLKAPWRNHGVARWVMASHADSPCHTLADPDGVDLATPVDEKAVREPIPRLHAAGARSIIEPPIDKIIE